MDWNTIVCRLCNLYADYEMCTHHSDEDEGELDDVGERHGVEAPKQGVRDGDGGREDHAPDVLEAHDHHQGPSWSRCTRGEKRKIVIMVCQQGMKEGPGRGSC